MPPFYARKGQTGFSMSSEAQGDDDEVEDEVEDEIC
jgi:hypothetical protein